MKRSLADPERLGIAGLARPLDGGARDYDGLMDLIGEAHFVLIGEASHGTHEFYAERARITQRLIEEKGFQAVAVEADWPDAYRVNRFVRGGGTDRTPERALGDFKRFPQWMWRNTDVVDFIDWLRSFNRGIADETRKVGFYGLDLYSLYGSIDAVIRYLDKVDPSAARTARERYACFEQFGDDPHGYARGGFALNKTCEDEVLRQLQDMRWGATDYLRRDGFAAEDELFFAEQNARLVRNAEEYYRSMFRGRVSSWNLRDEHMAETLSELAAHLERRGPRARIVVWEHNSHLGDARATEMGEAGELNVGQLVREERSRDAVLIGLTTHTGTVAAASDWDGPVERQCVNPSLPDSYERLFHESGLSRFYLPLLGHEVPETIERPRLERAIGVVYRPDSERSSHYFRARLHRQFDAVLHFDETTAVTPLEKAAGWGSEIPETYPEGL
jgi:erythromycin esterase-like protein